MIGLLSRHGSGKKTHSQVFTAVVSSTKKTILYPLIHQNVPKSAEIHSDTHPTYESLSADFVHKVVDHAETYVKDGVHTNG